MHLLASGRRNEVLVAAGVGGPERPGVHCTWASRTHGFNASSSLRYDREGGPILTAPCWLRHVASPLSGHRPSEGSTVICARAPLLSYRHTTAITNLHVRLSTQLVNLSSLQKAISKIPGNLANIELGTNADSSACTARRTRLKCSVATYLFPANVTHVSHGSPATLPSVPAADPLHTIAACMPRHPSLIMAIHNIARKGEIHARNEKKKMQSSGSPCARTAASAKSQKATPFLNSPC